MPVKSDPTARKRTYLHHFLEGMPRILSHMDRNPISPTYGCLDRQYWGWKLRDFPCASLQYGVYPLALIWSLDEVDNPYSENSRLLEWISAGLRFWTSIQRKNGAFDQVFPREHSFGATAYTILAALNTLGLLDGRLEEGLRSSVLAAIEKGQAFLLKNDETYGFIANHLALFAVTFAKLHQLLGNPQCKLRAEEYVRRLLGSVNDEGWLLEYEGPDPGYQTQCLYYLAWYRELAGDNELTDLLRRMVADFLVYFFHPDGSFGGEYGSRNTQIIYPAGFEMLCREVPQARAVVEFLRASIERGATPLLRAMDMENLLRLGANYLIAYSHCGPDISEDMPKLPWELRAVRRTFRGGGIVVYGNERYYCVTNARKGGVVKVFDKRRRILLWNDSGYSGSFDGKRVSTSVIQDAPFTVAPDSIKIEAMFHRVLLRSVTPLQFLFLRVLAITLFRSIIVGNLVKKFLVRLLITGRRPSPATLTRQIVFHDGAVEISDRLDSGRGLLKGLIYGTPFTTTHAACSWFFSAEQLGEPTGGRLLLEGRGVQTVRVRTTIDVDHDAVHTAVM